MDRRLVIALVVLGAALLLFFTPTGEVASQSQVRQVFVTNFPHPTHVEGEVTIKDPVQLAELVTFEDIIVPPVKPTDTTRLVEAGTLVTDGFPNVVLSLHGQVKGDVFTVGEVGAMLIPDQETIQEAFNEQELVHFAMRTFASGVSTKTPYFASDQPRFIVGFQAYKVFLYNTTDKTVTVNLFAYLTN
jgi:hypothetical protein